MSVIDKHIHRKVGAQVGFAVLLLLVFLDSCSPYKQNVTFLYKVNNYPIGHLIWSPKGGHLAFTSYSASLNISSIYILDVEKKEAQVLMTTDYGRLEALGWTPDGTELTFSANSSLDFRDGIWIVKINDQGAPRLYMDEKVGFGWSPANQVAIRRKDKAGNLSIYIRNLNTNQEKVVYEQPGVSMSPFSWSLDGNKLAFSLGLGVFRRTDIYIVDLETQEAKQLTNQGTNDGPTLSPNGNLIAYVKGNFSGAIPSYSLHVMNSDGSCDIELPELKDISSTAWSPAWSPDGKRIAFIGTNNQIFLFDVIASFGENFLISGLSCN